MTTENKNFKVKNGLIVGGSGDFSGPVSVADPTLPSHAVRKDYIDLLLGLAGLGLIDGGSATTTEWSSLLDGGLDAGTA